MHGDSDSLAARWTQLVEEAYSGRIEKSRTLEIAGLLLSDADDVRKSELTGTPDEFSPLVTPVERLILFVHTVSAKLRAETMGEGPYNHTQYPQLLNLSDLVAVALSESREPRAFSRLERTRLQAEQFALDSYCDQYHPERSDDRLSRPNDFGLRRLDGELASLPDCVEVAWLRGWLRYRKAFQHLRGRQRRNEAAVQELQALMSLDHPLVSPGLYLNAALEVLRLPSTDAKQLAGETRWPLAAAFALLPPMRLADRLAVGYLLALDAVWHGAPRAAHEVTAILKELEARDPAFVRLPLRVRRKVDRLGQQLEQELNSSRAKTIPPVGPTIAAYRRDLPVGVSEAPATIATDAPDLGMRLYVATLRTWRDMKASETKNSIQTVSVVSEFVDQVFGSFRRDDPVLCRMLVICQISRLLGVRAREEIDLTFDEFNRLLSLLVLGRDWQGLADNLQSWGQLNFLRKKLGFTSEAKRLEDVGKYLVETMGLVARPIEERQNLGTIDEELGEAVDNESRERSARQYGADHIEGRWQWRNADVKQWAKAFRKRSHEFTPGNSRVLSDGLTRSPREFFEEAGKIRKVGEELKKISNDVERIGLLRALAWSAYHFCQIARSVHARDRGDAGGRWFADGVEWAEELIHLSQKYERWAMLYAGLDVRVRLEDIRRPSPMLASREQWRARMLKLDERRLKTTRHASRRSRSVIKTERTIVEVMHRHWCEGFKAPVPLGDLAWMPFLEDLKTFNFGQLVQEDLETRVEAAEDVPDDEVLAPHSWSNETADGGGAPKIRAWPAGWEAQLARHLSEHKAAIVEFVVHPGGSGMTVDAAVKNAKDKGNQGTVGLVITTCDGKLVVRPVFLPVPEALVRHVVEGQGNGLKENLPDWPHDPHLERKDLRTYLRLLGESLFSENLESAIADCQRLYVCPHRHLAAVPIHALLTASGSSVCERWDVMYALKMQHIVDLLISGSAAATEKSSWALMNTNEFPESQLLLPRIGSNHWGERWGTEEILKRAAAAQRAVFFCHGQMDHVRPGKARLRLWGGGRLTSDDIVHAFERGGSNGGEWIFAACGAGAARVGMQTAPGLALTLVTQRAARVTSCLYEVKPDVASDFLIRYLHHSDQGGSAPFAETCRELIHDFPGDQGWARAASFVSYGLFGSAKNSRAEPA